MLNCAADNGGPGCVKSVRVQEDSTGGTDDGGVLRRAQLRYFTLVMVRVKGVEVLLWLWLSGI